jgi:hypothetical protein
MSGVCARSAHCWNLTVMGGAKTDGTPFARQLNVTSRGSAASVVVKPAPATTEKH